MRLWRLLRPDSLAGRTVLLLVGGLGLLHAGSMVIHERAMHGAEVGAFEARTADRILAAGIVAADRPPAERDPTVQRLSREGLTLEWRPNVPPVPSARPPQAFDVLLRQLGSDIWVAPSEAGTTARDLRGAVPLPAGGWVHFIVQPPPPHGFPAEPTDWGSMAAMTLGILVAAVAIVGWMTGPLRRLAEAAERVGRDPRPATMSIDGPVEVRHAAMAFNAMQARIVRLIEDRTEALAALSHDFRTPLARLRLRAGFLPEGEDRARIEAEVAEMEEMVSGVLAYFREGRDAEPAVPADLAAILQTLADEASDLGHDVRYDGPDHLILPLRRVAAKRAIRNLVTNALNHGNAPVSVSLSGGEGEATIKVADHGSGIAPEDRERALAPFIRLDAARGGGGVGLGLTTAARFALAEGGRLQLDSSPAGGLLVRMTLPISR